ncbi:MAG: polysaccharide deacetylase family protein [Eubacteriales bacterium]|nr:polysaccharide deacetylase family protein [Eubacteriales bacterium]
MKHLSCPKHFCRRRTAAVSFLFLAAFLAGRLLGFAVHGNTDAALPAAADGSWGLSFQQDGQPPAANASSDYLKQFNAHYTADTEEKVLYLTFDAGYENGNTAAILDALKKHNAPAAFFLVGNYLETSPDLVRRMTAEGHIVGNHTFHHPDMSKISSKEAFSRELQDLEALYEQVTGQPMKKFYRPPQGKYSESNLQMARDLGYHTFFWSLAYVDWYEDKQPTKEEAFKKLLGRIHPGAIVLLHSTSKTNGEILDELLTKWEDMGYQFRPLEDFQKSRPTAARSLTAAAAAARHSTKSPPTVSRQQLISTIFHPTGMAIT